MVSKIDHSGMSTPNPPSFEIETLFTQVDDVVKAMTDRTLVESSRCFLAERWPMVTSKKANNTVGGGVD